MISIIDLNDKVAQHICPECKGMIIQQNHESICEQCGLVVDDLYFTDSYQISEVKNTDLAIGDQFVSVGKVVDNVCTLGSHIGYYSSKTFYDYKNSIINSHNQKLYKKLKNYYSLPLKLKDKETDYRILKILNKVTNFLNLSPIVKNRAAYFFQKIKGNSSHIRNHVSLIAFCIFYASREFSQNAPISIRELSKTFNSMGHRISPKLIIRDSIDYQKLIKEKTKPHTSEDFIPRLVSSVINDPVIRSRMKKKKSMWTIEKYEIYIQNTCQKILKEINREIRGSRNPFILAGAIVYCADKYLAREEGTKSILTQSIAANAMGIAEYSIRDHYVKILKPYFSL